MQFADYVNDNYAFKEAIIDPLFAGDNMVYASTRRIQNMEQMFALRDKAFIIPEGLRFYIHLQDLESPQDGGWFKIVPEVIDEHPDAIVMTKPAQPEIKVLFTAINVENPNLIFNLILDFENNPPELEGAQQGGRRRSKKTKTRKQKRSTKQKKSRRQARKSSS